MKMKATSTIISLAVCVTLALAQDDAPPPGLAGVPGPKKPDCSAVLCLKPQCADPVTPPGKCCSSCANSKCKFRGCVQYEPNNQVRWLPDPCKICSCFKGKEICGAIGCQGFPGPDPCFGRPLTKVGFRPSVCCPRCNFGVREQACKAVPDKRRSFSISHKGGRCTGSVIEHKCDKIGYRKGGKKFRCQAVRRNRYVTLRGSRCNPFSRIAYNDVLFCRAVKDATLRGAEGCDKFIRVFGARGPK